MALVGTPHPGRVRWDRLAESTVRGRVGGRHLQVADLDTVRDERAAYQGRGPEHDGPAHAGR